MIFKTKDELNKVQLKMWESTAMKDSDIVEGPDGKKKFVPNGKFVDMTTYTFRDEFGSKLVIMSKNSDFRAYEGKYVDIELDVSLDEFTRKVKTRLLNVIPVASN